MNTSTWLQNKTNYKVKKMNIKEVITLSISIVVEAIASFVLTQMLSLEIWGVVLIVLLNIVVLLLLSLWFSKKIKKYEEKNAILSDMGIATEKNLLELKELHKNLDLLGIEGCTEKLIDTPFTPKICVQKVKKTLFFMGVAGSKWVKDSSVRLEFERMLHRVSAAKGEVRYLLLNPNGKGWKQLKKLRSDNLSDTSYDIYRELMKSYPCLKVRLYDPLPSFRLQFVDDTYVAVSRYKFEFSDYEKTHFGWDAPHLIVKNEVQEPLQETTKHFWSLYMAFQFLYDHIWNLSEELKP